MKNKIFGWIGMILAILGILDCFVIEDTPIMVTYLCVYGIFFYVSYLLKKKENYAKRNK